MCKGETRDQHHVTGFCFVLSLILLHTSLKGRAWRLQDWLGQEGNVAGSFLHLVHSDGLGLEAGEILFVPGCVLESSPVNSRPAPGDGRRLSAHGLRLRLPVKQTNTLGDAQFGGV